MFVSKLHLKACSFVLCSKWENWKLKQHSTVVYIVRLQKPHNNGLDCFPRLWIVTKVTSPLCNLCKARCFNLTLWISTIFFFHIHNNPFPGCLQPSIISTQRNLPCNLHAYRNWNTYTHSHSALGKQRPCGFVLTLPLIQDLYCWVIRCRHSCELTHIHNADPSINTSPPWAFFVF